MNAMSLGDVRYWNIGFQLALDRRNGFRCESAASEVSHRVRTLPGECHKFIDLIDGEVTL